MPRRKSVYMKKRCRKAMLLQELGSDLIGRAVTIIHGDHHSLVRNGTGDNSQIGESLPWEITL